MNTILLVDKPATVDEFGPHQAIADQLAQIILQEPDGHSVALLGEWGSGKSTIVNLAAEALKAAKAPICLFMYDAWAHQGDHLRRSFLADLIGALEIGAEDEEALKQRIWNTDEHTHTTTESVLRPHAKVLLALAALVPIAWQFLDIPPGTTSLIDGFGYPRNWVAVLLLAPIVLYAVFCVLVGRFGSRSLQERVFGPTDDIDVPNSRASKLMSLMFSSVSSHVERKLASSPADSVREFRDVFTEAIAAATRKQAKLKLVIVVDNVDRLQNEQLRDFWTTMQTFFGDRGGRRGSDSKQPFWLVVPFSYGAIANTFGLDSRDTVRGFIDKSFWLSMYVPRPITGSWRTYLKHLLETAFPDHSEYDRSDAREMYDLSLEVGQDPPTPRSLKLFVNSMVGLFRVHSGEVPIAAIVSYLLVRDSIRGTSIPDDLLTSPQRRICGKDWKTQLAALHFGVGAEEAAQLVLEDPVRLALVEGNSENLASLSQRRGFADVLTRFIHHDLGDGGYSSSVSLFSSAAAMDSLSSDQYPETSMLWRALQTQFDNLPTWDGLSASLPRGLRALLRRLPEERRKQTVIDDAVAKMSAIDVAGSINEEDAAFDDNFPRMYAEASIAIAEEANSIGLQVLIPIPAVGSLALNALAIIARQKESVIDQVDNRCSPAMLTDALVGKIAAGRVADDLKDFVVLAKRRSWSIDWMSVLAAIGTRLARTDLEMPEIDQLARLVLSIYYHSGAGRKEISALGLQEHLCRYLYGDPGAIANAPIMSFLLSNDTASSIDNDYESYLSSTDDNLAGQLASIAARHGFRSLYLRKLLEDDHEVEIVTAVVQHLVSRRERFSVTDKYLYDRLDKIVEFRSRTDWSAALGNIADFAPVQRAVVGGGFQPKHSFVYVEMLHSGAVDAAFSEWLEACLLGFGSEYWFDALTRSDGVDRIDVAHALREKIKLFELKTGAADAAEQYLREIASADINITDDGRLAFSRLMEVIPRRRAALMKRFFGWLQDQTSEVALRALDLCSASQALPRGLSMERTFRGIVLPVVHSKDDQLHKWLLDAMRSGSFDPGKLSKESVEDLSAHIDAAMAAAPSDTLRAIRAAV